MQYTKICKTILWKDVYSFVFMIVGVGYMYKCLKNDNLSNTPLTIFTLLHFHLLIL